MTNEHTFFRKIYLSHFIRERVAKGLCLRGDLKTEQTAIYWLQVPLTIAALLSHSARLLNRGSWGPIALCWELVLTASNCNSNSNSNWPQLTRTVCGTGLYNYLTSTCFLWASHLHRIQPFHSQGDIFDRMHLFLDWRLGWRSICYIIIIIIIIIIIATELT